MHDQNCLPAAPAPAFQAVRTEFVRRDDGARSQRQPVMARFGHEVARGGNSASLARRHGIRTRRSAKQFEGCASGQFRRDALAGGKDGADDVHMKGCHIASHVIMFNLEQNSSIMNDLQEAPWTNPRFRNWIALIRAHKAVILALAKALAPLDLKIGQLDMLMNIHRHPGMSQQELAERLLIGRSNITMLLPQLEASKLVAREPDAKDKRVMRLSLTPAGETLLAEALKVYSELVEQVMGASSEEECNMIGASMTRITEMLKDSDSR